MPQCIYAAYKRVYLSNIIKMRFLAILSTLCNGIPPRLWYTPPMSTEHIDLIKLHQCCTQKIFNLNYCFKLLHLCVPEESKTQTNRNQLETLEATSEGIATPTTLTSFWQVQLIRLLLRLLDFTTLQILSTVKAMTGMKIRVLPLFIHKERLLQILQQQNGSLPLFTLIFYTRHTPQTVK